MALDDGASEAVVGDDLVEAGHHVGLRHHRQVGEILDLEPVRVDAAQPPGMEGRAPGGVAEQRAQPLPLVAGELVATPPEPGDVLVHPRGQFVADPATQGLQVIALGSCHRRPA